MIDDLNQQITEMFGENPVFYVYTTGFSLTP